RFGRAVRPPVHFDARARASATRSADRVVAGVGVWASRNRSGTRGDRAHHETDKTGWSGGKGEQQGEEAEGEDTPPEEPAESAPRPDAAAVVARACDTAVLE